MKKAVLKVLLGSIIVEALLVCVFILIGNFDDLGWQSISSVAVIMGYSIPCLFYSRIYESEKYRYIAITGSVVVAITAVLSILAIWELVEDGELLGRTLGTTNVLVAMLAFTSWVLSYVSDNKLFNVFKRINLSLIPILSIFSIWCIWEGFPEGFFSRLYYVLVVLTVGSLICTLILTRLYKKEITDLSKIEEKQEKEKTKEKNEDSKEIEEKTEETKKDKEK